MRYSIVIATALLFFSCHRNSSNEEMSRFHEDGRVKPAVAVASVIDTTPFDVSWSLSEEFTNSIMQQIARGKQIYVHAQAQSPFSQNPFGSDLSWMKREFHTEEFVAFLELVEHEFIPVKQKGLSEKESSLNLNMAVRLRVIDLRGAFPKIVLQEMIRDSYFIPKSVAPCDYSIDTWGTEGFRKTPMGIAHAQITQEISSRISEYILLAKSR